MNGQTTGFDDKYLFSVALYSLRLSCSKLFPQLAIFRQLQNFIYFLEKKSVNYRANASNECIVHNNNKNDISNAL